MALLEQTRILAIFDAAVVAGLAGERALLLGGIDPHLVADLPIADRPSAELLGDLQELNTLELADGTVPLRTWLSNAAALAGPGRERELFLRALADIGGAPLPPPVAATGPVAVPHADPQTVVAANGALRLLARGSGSIGAVALDGDHLYLAAGVGLQVLDVSGGPAWREIAFFKTPGILADLCLSGGLALLASTEGLIVVDVSTPSAPALRGSVKLAFHALCVTVNGDRALVGGESSTFSVVSLEDPGRPRVLGELTLPGDPWRIAATATHAYVACDAAGLTILDLADPAAPRRIGILSGEAREVAIRGETLFLGAGDDALRVFAIDDPARPRELRPGHPSPLFRRRLLLAGELGYSAGNGLTVVDLHDPASPRALGGVDALFDCSGVEVSAGRAYIGAGPNGLRVVDVSDPAAPFETWSFVPHGDVWRVVAAGGLLYAAQGGGVGVFDPSELPCRRIGFAGAVGPGGTSRLAVAPPYVFVAAGNGGLRIVDAAYPDAPAEVAALELPAEAPSVAISGSIAYVGLKGGSLAIVDVSDPTAPALKKIVKIPGGGEVEEVIVAGDRVIVGAFGSGVHVFDATSPANLVHLGTFATGTPAGLAVAGEILFVAGLYSGLEVVSLADPRRPRLLASRDDQSGAAAVILAGAYAYVAGPGRGVTVYDVSRPSNPHEVSRLVTPGRPSGLVLVGSRLFIADGEGGLSVAGVAAPG